MECSVVYESDQNVSTLTVRAVKKTGYMSQLFTPPTLSHQSGNTRISAPNDSRTRKK